MALAYCLRHIETNDLARITVYGEFLEKYPPEHEVEIWENSSWSCAHGVERWKSNCGCASGQASSGQQHWRAPLRVALDWLRDKLGDAYERFMSQYDVAPWSLRNDYIDILHDRSVGHIDQFLQQAIGRPLTSQEDVALLKSLEMQRNAMLMYTSCGWFFDNLSGIETVQVMQYAARAIQLCLEVQQWDLAEEFKTLLAQAPANNHLFANGREVYEAYVEPAQVDLSRVGAHLAISSMFDRSPNINQSKYCYTAAVLDYHRVEAGVQVLTTCQVSIRSTITLEEQPLEFVVFYLGDLNLFSAVRAGRSDQAFAEMHGRMKKAFLRADSNEVVRLMNIDFDGKNYSLSHLFQDQRREILDQLLKNTWDNIEKSFRHIYEHDYAIISMLRSMNMPLPKALSAPVEIIINKDLIDEIQREQINLDRIQELTREAERLSLSLDKEKLALEASHRIHDIMLTVAAHPRDIERLERAERTVQILRRLAPSMDLHNAQNVLFEVARQHGLQDQASAEAPIQPWIKRFLVLADHLELAIR